MSQSGDRSLVRRVFLNGRERRLRAGWRLFFGVIAYGIATLVAALSVGFTMVVAGALLPVAGTDVVPLTLASQFFVNVIVTVLLIGLAWFVDARTIPDLGLGGKGWWANLGFGLVLGLVMTTVVFAVELATGLVTVQDVLAVRSGLVSGFGFPATLALTFLFFIAVGVGEEVFFRGYLMTNLAEGLNGLGSVGPRGALGIAAVLTSSIFGLVHIANPNATLISALNITVVGLFLAGAYIATEDLGISIGIHITWNFSLSSVYGFPVSGMNTPATILDVRQTGDPLVTGGQFGPEAGLVVYLALAVAVALTWLWIRRTEGSVGFPIDVAVPHLRKPADDAETPPQTAGDGAD